MSAAPCSGPPFHSAVIAARVRIVSNAARARASSSPASAAARACPNTLPASDCANIRASTSICLPRVLSRFIGIESPCFNAFRLERALPAEVFGPRPSKPLRRLAADLFSRGHSAICAMLLIARSSVQEHHPRHFFLQRSPFQEAQIARGFARP